MATQRNDPCSCGSGRKYKHCCLIKDRETTSGPILPPHVREGASEAQIWEADLIAMPGVRGNKPHGGSALCLVVADGFILQAEVLEATVSEIEETASILEKHVLEGARKVGVLPSRIRVGYPEIAETLAPLLRPRGIVHVQAEPFVDIPDAVRSFFDQFYEGGAWPPGGTRETWQGWGRSPAEIGDLFRAAAGFFRFAPWRFTYSDRPLLAWMADGREWSTAIMGAAEGEFGLGLYSSFGDFMAILEGEQKSVWENGQGRIFGLTFESLGDLPRRMQKEIVGAGWEVTSPQAYPLLLSARSPGGGIYQTDWDDLVALLQAIPRFFETTGGVVEGDPPDPWFDPETGVRLLLLPEEGIEDESRILAPGGPEGPGADPLAVRDPDTPASDDDLEPGVLATFWAWLVRGGFADSTVRKHTGNVEELLFFLWNYQGIPVRALHEYDLREFLFDWVHRKSGLSMTRVEALPGSLRRFFDFMREELGIRLPWSKAVVAERELYRYRADTCPGGPFWDPETRDWMEALTMDLFSRVLVHDNTLGADGEWGATMGSVEWSLHNQLQRLWLTWRDEVIRNGITDAYDVGRTVLARQREWETKPNALVGNQTPLKAIEAERSRTGDVPPPPWGP